MRLDPDGYLIVCDTALGIYKVNVATGMLISAWCCYSDFFYFSNIYLISNILYAYMLV